MWGTTCDVVLHCCFSNLGKIRIWRKFVLILFQVRADLFLVGLTMTWANSRIVRSLSIVRDPSKWYYLTKAFYMFEDEQVLLMLRSSGEWSMKLTVYNPKIGTFKFQDKTRVFMIRYKILQREFDITLLLIGFRYNVVSLEHEIQLPQTICYFYLCYSFCT
jgi:hypothetical protein